MTRHRTDWPDWLKVVGVIALLCALLVAGIVLDGWRAERWARAWKDAGNSGAMPGVPR